MRIFLIIVFLFLLVNISVADEIFIGYLKPYTKKSESKDIFKRRDPTQEPYKISEKIIVNKSQQKVEDKISDIELKAILFHPIYKKAYINESLVTEGELVGEGIIVKEINQDYVKVEKNKKTYILKIEEGDKR